MGTEFFELCHETLSSLLKEKELTQAELAHRLSISKKTIQRWVNRTTRRVSHDTLTQLATALGTTAEKLIRSAEKIQVRPYNTGLKELTSEEYLLKVRLTADWASYRRILASYIADDLPSQQQAVLFKNLGIASLYLGKLRAGKTYLEKSISIAKTLGDRDTKSLSYSWLAVREELNGNLHEASMLVQKAESLLSAKSCAITISTFHFLKGRLFFHSEKYDQAIVSMKQAIIESYKSETPGVLLMTAVFYLHLTWVYLRQRDLQNATIALNRVQRLAEKIGWVRGQAIIHLSYATISLLKNEYCPLAKGRVKKGRSLNKLAPRRPLDSRLEQLEFIHHIANGDFEKAKDVALMRLSWAQPCQLYTSYAILDCLFLSKLSPQILVVRASLVEKAQRVFRENQLQESTEAIEFLLSAPSITIEDFLNRYLF
ncbi:helix-turn-helix domain-containing protein [Bdellovibrio sp. HCB2-146]|uniref:helix-turn-helix domain-containing protein n=1 Tax=Bdellovibrio sp. HCB2-146 TaxID=3394362 RepID=UPI0039BCB2BB